jgi:hypothetical protein
MLVEVSVTSFFYCNMNIEEKNLETGEATVAHSEFAGNSSMDVPRVTWWKHRGLRKLYPMMPILFLGSTINGYDGSLLNGLQTMTPWQDCEH